MHDCGLILLDLVRHQERLHPSQELHSHAHVVPCMQFFVILAVGPEILNVMEMGICWPQCLPDMAMRVHPWASSVQVEMVLLQLLLRVTSTL